MTEKKAHTGQMSPEYAFLGLLMQKPAHGYKLHQRLESQLGQIWHISQSQAYSILNRLEGRGWIRAELQPQKNRPDKRLLHVTQTGQQEFQDWLNQPAGSSVRAIRVEFLTRLHFARSLYPERVERLLDEQTAAVQEGIRRLSALRAQLPADALINRLGLDLRIRQLESILDWLAECQTTLKEDSRRNS